MLVFWVGNAQNVAQVDTITVTGVVTGGTLTATINGKAITYTVVSGDTTATAATNWFTLLTAATIPPEFGEITFTNPSSGVILAASATPGLPFTLTTSAAGGCTLTQVHTTPNGSGNDPGNAANWLRGGVAILPQAGDDMVLANSRVSLLYNLAALASIPLNSVTRWQTFTGTIGLPENNPAGYYEYRPTYLSLLGPVAGTLPVTLGLGQAGNGPSRERYNVGGQLTRFTVLNSGSPADETAVRFLGTNPGNTMTVVNTSVAVAMLPTEVATLATVTLDGGAFVELGPGCTCTTLQMTSSQALLMMAPSSVTLFSGSQIIMNTAAGQTPASTPAAASSGSSSLSSTTLAGGPIPQSLTVGTILARSGSVVTWLSDANVTSLVLRTGSIFDKSGDVRPMTIANLTMDADTAQVLDPNNAITFQNPALLENPTAGGPIQVNSGRTVKVT